MCQTLSGVASVLILSTTLSISYEVLHLESVSSLKKLISYKMEQSSIEDHVQ